jgi:hypothetical protein
MAVIAGTRFVTFRNEGFSMGTHPDVCAGKTCRATETMFMDPSTYPCSNRRRILVADFANCFSGRHLELNYASLLHFGKFPTACFGVDADLFGFVRRDCCGGSLQLRCEINPVQSQSALACSSSETILRYLAIQYRILSSRCGWV